MAQKGELPSAELATKVRKLLGLQYHVIPVLSQSGKKVVTRYFAEAEEGMATSEGLKITKVEHIEEQPEENDPESPVVFEKSEITLSAAPPAETERLSFLKAQSMLTQAGFKIGEINQILEVLEK